MRRVLGVVVIVVFALGALWLAVLVLQPGRSTESLQPTEQALRTFRVGSAMLSVELARTPDEWARGLSGRRILPNDHGMLFLFPDTVTRTFWMHETHIPLDIIWIRNGQVIGVTANVQPEPGAPEAYLKRYPSPGPIEQVLEVKSGWAAARGIVVGDAVRLVD